VKWFKHISDSLDDPFIFDLIDQFGGDGYLVFFGVLEIISREFDVDSPGTCQLSIKFLTKKLQLSPKKISKVLEFCQKHHRILSSSNGDGIELSCPKLADLCDDYTEKQIKGHLCDYNGGKESWKRIKTRIRRRDNYCCGLCNKSTEENKRSLQVHHIVHFKKFESADEANEDTNLISLCNSCHNKVRKGKYDGRLKELIRKKMEKSRTESGKSSRSVSNSLEEEGEKEGEEEGEKDKRLEGDSSQTTSSPDSISNVVFSCPYFRVEQNYIDKLLNEYQGIDLEFLLKLFSKIEDYVSDRKEKYKRDTRGRLKNPKSVIRNWLEKEILGPDRSKTGKNHDRGAGIKEWLRRKKDNGT